MAMSLPGPQPRVTDRNLTTGFERSQDRRDFDPGALGYLLDFPIGASQPDRPRGRALHGDHIRFQSDCSIGERSPNRVRRSRDHEAGSGAVSAEPGWEEDQKPNDRHPEDRQPDLEARLRHRADDLDEEPPLQWTGRGGPGVWSAAAAP